MVWFIEQSGAFKLSREGFVVLQFAPASGVRHYDWDRKQVTSTIYVHMIRRFCIALMFLIFLALNAIRDGIRFSSQRGPGHG